VEDYNKLIRLHVPAAGYAAGKQCGLSEGQAHYLRNVMRKSAGEPLRVFNGQEGDWLATLAEISKNKAVVTLDKQITEQKNSPDIWVLASPIKKEPFDWMVEKSCELGAAKFLPVLCEHTAVRKINRERLQAIAVEAAEQCERGDVMAVEDLSGLKDCLNSLGSGRDLIFCLERGEVPGFAETLRGLPPGPLAILIGPEGGFSDGEIAFIKNLPRVHPVSLGDRVLRAETALVSALVGVQLCVK
jgi:16S rRNA (uracil1498-N3)-methyltransferase